MPRSRGIVDNRTLGLRGRPMERTVSIWDNPNTVSVYRKSKTVWIAIGDYIGKHIEVRDQSERRAQQMAGGGGVQGQHSSLLGS